MKKTKNQIKGINAKIKRLFKSAIKNPIGYGQGKEFYFDNIQNLLQTKRDLVNENYKR